MPATASRARSASRSSAATTLPPRTGRYPSLLTGRDGPKHLPRHLWITVPHHSQSCNPRWTRRPVLALPSRHWQPSMHKPTPWLLKVSTATVRSESFPSRTAPLCQEAVLFDDFGSSEKVIVKMTGGVEDFDADQAAVFPVERDEPFAAGREAGRDCGAAGRERLASEVDVDRVGRRVVGDLHLLIVPWRSATICR